MVERSLSMREVPGSIPGSSIAFFPQVLMPLNNNYSIAEDVVYLQTIIFAYCCEAVVSWD